MNIIVDYTHFQKRLRDLVESRGKSFREVADEIGISKTTLSRYINGHREPELKYIVALAQYFNVSVDWILGLCEDRFDALPFYAKDLVQLFSLASPGDRSVVEAVLCKYDNK